MSPKLIIGIGNPGPEYAQTRHNIGWLFLDYLARQAGVDSFVFEKKFNAEIAKGTASIGGKETSVILVKPYSFVNATGPVVAKLKNFYKVTSENIIVVQDDLDIAFGNFKLSFDKNSGGHQGVESIIKSLKTKKFWRLRLGTQNIAYRKAHQQSSKKKDELVRNIVLSTFSKKESETLKSLFKEALARLAQK